MRYAIYVFVAALAASVAGCQAVTGQNSLSFGLEEAGAGAGGKGSGGAGKAPPPAAGEGGDSGDGAGGMSGDGGKAGASGKGGMSGGGGASGKPAGGSGGQEANDCPPSVPGAPCNLVKHCGCPDDQVCTVTDIKGATASVGCAKLNSPAPPGSICSGFLTCTEGYSCVGSGTGTCRQYCETDPDCGSKGRCKPVQATVDTKKMDVPAYNVCFEACSKASDCATGCCTATGICAAASYCNTCTKNSDCTNGCCESGMCKAADQCKVSSDIPNLECIYGSEHYTASPFGTGECAQCGATNCCDGMVKCMQDKDGACFMNCFKATGATVDSCLSQCKLSELPAPAVSWMQCVINKCENSCNLDMVTPMMTPSTTCVTPMEAGFTGGTCTTAPQCGCTSSEKCNVNGSGITSCGAVGTVAQFASCTDDASCQKGFGCFAGVCMQYCAKLGDPLCGMASSCKALTSSGNPVPGAFACTRCDPVMPPKTGLPFAACSGKCSPATDGRTFCSTATGTSMLGGPCMDANGDADSNLCAPGFFCEISSKTCKKFCHVGSTDECSTGGTCTFFATRQFAGATEIGGCF